MPDIQVGARVEISGTRKTDSSLAAARISFRKPSNILLVGQAFGTTASTFNVFGLKITVNASTRYKDSAGSNPLKTFRILDLANGDTLKVTGFRDSSSLAAVVIVATSVERIDAVQSNRKILQGLVDSKEPFSGSVRKLTILGLDAQTTDGLTEFLQADGNPFPSGGGFTAQDRFFDAVTSNLVYAPKGTENCQVFMAKRSKTTEKMMRGLKLSSAILNTWVNFFLFYNRTPKTNRKLV